MRQSKVIGLTGGIASGKSTVSNYLKQLGIPIVDADVISREVVAPGSVGLKKIVESFGSQILIEGQLNRKVLRTIIFEDEDKRLLLNEILHPIIHDKVVFDLNRFRMTHPLVVFDAPLLLENQLMTMVDVLWVVSCDTNTQISRVMKRDGIDENQAKQIVARQMPLSEKEKFADVILYNDTTIEALCKQIDKQLESL